MKILTTTAIIMAFPVVAFAQCPSVPTACPSPTYDNVTVGGTLGVIGSTSVGNISASGFLAVTGNTTMTSAQLSGTLSANAATFGNSSNNYTITEGIDSNTNALIYASPGGSAGGPVSLRLQVTDGYVQLFDTTSTTPLAPLNGSVDLQLFRAVNTDVASGSQAVAIGASNTASGTNSTAIGKFNIASGLRTVALGYSNAASGQGSIALGQSASDHGIMSSMVFAGGYTGQSTTFEIGGQSASGTAIRLTADGNAAGAANVMNLPSNYALGGEMTVAARNTGNGDSAFWRVNTLYKNVGGVLTVSAPSSASIAPTVADTSLSTATLTITADATNLGLNVTVTPPSGVTIHAAAVLQGAQIQ